MYSCCGLSCMCTQDQKLALKLQKQFDREQRMGHQAPVIHERISDPTDDKVWKLNSSRASFGVSLNYMQVHVGE